MKSNLEHFQFSSMALKRAIANLYSSKYYRENESPTNNDHIRLLVVLERCFIRRPPAQDDHT